jgi:hypothetical protein
LFKRQHHIKIASVLQSLDSDLLNKYSCLFGGGTAIVLCHNEYRESVDIDFLISERTGYQELRNLLLNKGLSVLTRNNMKLEAVRDIRADQYGIRTMLRVGDVEIKFEIIFEARIQLENFETNNLICGVRTLTSLDMATSKLLANSDRWLDDSVFSRDLIDLAMLDLSVETKKLALHKAFEAYGESVMNDLVKAIKSLNARRGRLDVCMKALKIDDVPKALLWSRIRDLKKI